VYLKFPVFGFGGHGKIKLKNIELDIFEQGTIIIIA